jgi:hypothetical protein
MNKPDMAQGMGGVSGGAARKLSAHSVCSALDRGIGAKVE